MTIFAGMISEGTSNLKYHALRPDGAAACSSSLLVYRQGAAARIEEALRCRAKACQKLFLEADLGAKANSEMVPPASTGESSIEDGVTQFNYEALISGTAGASGCVLADAEVDGDIYEGRPVKWTVLVPGSKDAELEALRRDAALYRWIRERSWYIDSAADALGMIPARKAWGDKPHRPDWDEVEDALVAVINGENEHVSEYE